MSNCSKPLTGLLSWEPADELIERIRAIGPWYIHSPENGMETLFVAEAGEAAAFLAARIEDVKDRKRGAGWVYVHTPDAPSWIKIYDPYKCASCGTRSPKAWWEMKLEDPRGRLPAEAPENKRNKGRRIPNPRLRYRHLNSPEKSAELSRCQTGRPSLTAFFIAKLKKTETSEGSGPKHQNVTQDEPE